MAAGRGVRSGTRTPAGGRSQGATGLCARGVVRRALFGSPESTQEDPTMRKLAIMTLAILASLMTLAAFASTAAAGSFTYYGPHMGFAQNPDETVIGGQLQWNGVAPRMAFVPSVDLGFNDAQSVLMVNADFHYQLTHDTAWQPYVGAGVGLQAWSDEQAAAGTNDRKAGGQVIVGAATRNNTGGRFFTELRMGFGDMPDLRMTVGLNLRAR